MKVCFPDGKTYYFFVTISFRINKNQKTSSENILKNSLKFFYYVWNDAQVENRV